MKLIAHRGWSAGTEENSLTAFSKAASDDRVAGIEFDVRRAADGTTLVVAHDTPGKTALTLEAALSFLAGTELELLIELKERDLAFSVIDSLVSRKLAERSLVFGFAETARSFPWKGTRPAGLGIIVRFPWTIDRAMRTFRPDVLLLGWDERAWTRIAFRGWWSALSLSRIKQRYGVPVVVGVVQRQADLDWLVREEIDTAVADMDWLAEDADAASGRDR